jgi:succinate dehydrogenase hydrophobic anchor subunit
MLYIIHCVYIKHIYKSTTYSSVVIMCTSIFNFKKFCLFLPSLYTAYDSRKTAAILVPYNINRLVFLMQAHTAVREVQTPSLNSL